jgi:HAMP domain-containing protein
MFFRQIGVKVTIVVNMMLFIVISSGTFYLVTQQYASLEEIYKNEGKMMSSIGAKAVSRIMEDAVDNGALSITDVFDVAYVAMPDTDPIKYHTKYDTYTDKAILSLEDIFLKNPTVVFGVAVDVNGYLPTHNTKYQHPLTGDKEKDKVGNRTKRLFNDPVGLKAAENTIEGLIQVYKRDTGETMWDIDSPIVIKGKTWGNFRIGLSMVALDQAKSALLVTLVGIMGAIFVCSVFLVMLVVKVMLRPLTVFTASAIKIADGDVELKIDTGSNDEVGDLGKALERMRLSLKFAMDRLRKRS